MSTGTDAEWYWSKKGSGERNGPVGREQLEKLAEEGDLEPEDLVWCEGFDDWKEAGSVEEIEELFVSPPPLPSGQNSEIDATGEPPSLPQDKKQESSYKATESEALSCIHDYDQNGVCKKCGWSKVELKKIDKGNPINTGENESTVNINKTNVEGNIKVSKNIDTNAGQEKFVQELKRELGNVCEEVNTTRDGLELSQIADTFGSINRYANGNAVISKKKEDI